MLDWRLWFLSNEHARGLDPPDWYLRLMKAVLEGNEAVLALLGKGARDGGEVRWVRTLVYDYRFVWGSEQDAAERKAEEARRRKRREEERLRIAADDAVGDEEGLEAWRRARRQNRARESAEGERVAINPQDWWYRLRFVGQYGPTLSKDS